MMTAVRFQPSHKCSKKANAQTLVATPWTIVNRLARALVEREVLSHAEALHVLRSWGIVPRPNLHC
jgi:hypothetical protein